MFRLVGLKNILFLAFLILLAYFGNKLTYSHSYFFPFSVIAVACAARLRTLNKGFILGIFILIFFSIGFLVFDLSSNFIRLAVLEIFAGIISGLIYAAMVFPVNIRKRFFGEVVLVLNNIRGAIKLLHTGDLPNVLKALIQPSFNWVFELGFNPGLRMGMRYFILRLERVGEVLTALAYGLSHVDSIIMSDITPELEITLERNSIIVSQMIAYFAEGKTLNLAEVDLTDDLVKLERSIYELIPLDIEQIEIVPSRLTMADILIELKSLRQTLIDLVNSLGFK